MWHFQGLPAPKASGGDAALDASALLPSVLCAIEMALLQIVAQSMEVPLTVAAAMLTGMSAPKKEAAGSRCCAEAAVVHSHVHLNALLMRTEKLQQAFGESRSPHSEGGGAGNGRQDVCSVVKVKVGGNSPVGAQAARVRAIVDQARALQQRIRLDANQCWSLPQVHVSRNAVCVCVCVCVCVFVPALPRQAPLRCRCACLMMMSSSTVIANRVRAWV
jgi:L-alanine-DL-glutamate epimerase-like enolase superfamily enzyme